MYPYSEPTKEELAHLMRLISDDMDKLAINSYLPEVTIDIDLNDGKGIQLKCKTHYTEEDFNRVILAYFNELYKLKSYDLD